MGVGVGVKLANATKTSSSACVGWCLGLDFVSTATLTADEALRLFVVDNPLGFRIPFDFST